MRVAAVLLIVLGVLALVYGGVTYTSRDTIVDLGPLHATADRQHTVPLPPLAGAGMVAVGTLILVFQKRR